MQAIFRNLKRKMKRKNPGRKLLSNKRTDEGSNEQPSAANVHHKVRSKDVRHSCLQRIARGSSGFPAQLHTLMLIRRAW